MAQPYANVVEDPHDHPEWVTLVNPGNTGDRLRVIEWDASTGEIRVSGPVIYGERHIHPAP